MKVILLFDTDTDKAIHQEYIFNYDEDLRKGMKMTVTFAHPKCGEIMLVKTDSEKKSEIKTSQPFCEESAWFAQDSSCFYSGECHKLP